MDNETKYWLAFNRIPGIGRVRFAMLKEQFGSLASAWASSAAELRGSGLDPRSASAILAMRPRITPDEEIERLENAGVRALTLDNPEYPARLREIYDPPVVLYVKGNLLPEDDWSITIVGTRTPTAYGREVASRLVRELARNKITVYSGLARGIDAVAHETALECGGRTIAVQACGLDQVYPASHASLARRISEHGAVVSDYPLGTKPRAEYFPRRNRILAGFTRATLVVEAGEKSGALITAKFAAEEGREVMAVPGSILSPLARGCNRLIQDGAKAILDVEDILEELNVRVVAQQQQMALPGLVSVTTEEAGLLSRLSEEPSHVDSIGRGSGLPIAVVSSSLVVLELKGLVKQVGSMNYVLSPGARYETAPAS